MTNYSTIIKQQDCINIIEEGLMSWEKVLTGYLKTVKNELLEKEILEKKNVELTKEVESLRADYLFEKENSWQLQQEIQSHLNTIKNLQDQRDSYLERISKDLTAQTKLIKANYEVNDFITLMIEYE